MHPCIPNISHNKNRLVTSHPWKFNIYTFSYLQRVALANGTCILSAIHILSQLDISFYYWISSLLAQKKCYLLIIWKILSSIINFILSCICKNCNNWHCIGWGTGEKYRWPTEVTCIRASSAITLWMFYHKNFVIQPLGKEIEDLILVEWFCKVVIISIMTTRCLQWRWYCNKGKDDNVVVVKWLYIILKVVLMVEQL